MNKCKGSSPDLKPQHTLPIDKVLSLPGTWKKLTHLHCLAILISGSRSHPHSRWLLCCWGTKEKGEEKKKKKDTCLLLHLHCRIKHEESGQHVWPEYVKEMRGLFRETAYVNSPQSETQRASVRQNKPLGSPTSRSQGPLGLQARSQDTPAPPPPTPPAGSVAPGVTARAAGFSRTALSRSWLHFPCHSVFKRLTKRWRASILIGEQPRDALPHPFRCRWRR